MVMFYDKAILIENYSFFFTQEVALCETSVELTKSQYWVTNDGQSKKWWIAKNGEEITSCHQNEDLLLLIGYI